LKNEYSHKQTFFIPYYKTFQLIRKEISEFSEKKRLPNLCLAASSMPFYFYR